VLGAASYATQLSRAARPKNDMKLILAGGGDATQSTKVDMFYCSLNPGRKTIACIPQAIEPAGEAWDEAEKWLLERSALRGFDAHTIRDLAKVNVDKLRSYHSIFIMGGNTFTLLSLIKAAGFDATLKAALNDVLIYGISAGAIILGHDIESAQIGPEADENTIGLHDFSALNFLAGHNVHAHFAPDQSQMLMDFCKKSHRPCIALSERAGVFVDDLKVSNIGADTVMVAYPSGESISLEEGSTISLMSCTL
jgi:dipeptidase E